MSSDTFIIDTTPTTNCGWEQEVSRVILDGLRSKEVVHQGSPLARRLRFTVHNKVMLVRLRWWAGICIWATTEEAEISARTKP